MSSSSAVRRVGVGRLAVLSVVAALTSLGAVGISGASATLAPTVTRLVPVHECATPKPGHASCHAMRLILEKVKAGTSGHAARRATSSLPGYITGPAGGYTPSDLATAYGVNPA